MRLRNLESVVRNLLSHMRQKVAVRCTSSVHGDIQNNKTPRQCVHLLNSAPRHSPVTVDLATNKPCFAFSTTGLPPGVTIDGSAGRLAGTPSAAGSFLARITARNEAGPHTKEYLIRVAPALPPLPEDLIPLATALDFSPWEDLPRSGTVFLGGVVDGAVQTPWSGAVTDLARDGADAAVVVLTDYTARHSSEDRAFSTKVRTVVEGPGVFSIWHRAAIPPALPGLTAVPVAVIFDHWINGVYGAQGTRHLRTGIHRAG